MIKIKADDKESVKGQLVELFEIAHRSKEDYGSKFEDLAELAIKYFVSILPEEQSERWGEEMSRKRGEAVGHNECLAGIKRSLGVEKCFKEVINIK